ncbi:Abi family protein [Weissella paramesenteroides]|uniref:Abi family protein n=1 Tax=Weissella paramesenteroides TaxID=1249 RepID=A0ABD4XLB6_WEIPA|nr:Abi family protein [Weissella paramesenteroides]MDF8369751.1 Abi family protein [Weissella paramesenteroides]MDF8371765.1 Abi family protein [Weissella paramesenteroides]
MNIQDEEKSLVDIFNNRGMSIDSENASTTIKNVGYYKLKEYARPFINNGSYDGLLFSSVLKRYFFDKNLRIHLLHIIEMIELAFKNSLAELIGNECGPFGYLEFLDWADQKIYTSEYIIKEQSFIKNTILKMTENMNRCSHLEYFDSKNLISKGDKYNYVRKYSEYNNYPTVWLAFDLLSFGQLHHIYQLLPSESKDKIAKNFNCGSSQLNSWIGSMVLVRNACAHSSNLIDIEFKTLPKTRNNWKEYLDIHKRKSGKEEITNKLASVIIPIVDLAHNIDENYGFGDIHRDIQNAIKPVRKDGENQAQALGFSSKAKMNKFFSIYLKDSH